MKQTVVINGMTCGGCVNSVRALLQRVEGVNNVEVELSNGETTLDVEHELPISELKDALKILPQYQIVD